MASKVEQLDWESRAGKFAAIAAFGAIILSVGSNVYVSSTLDRTPESGNTRQLLEIRDAQPEAFMTGAVLSAIGTLLLIAVLLYLYRVTKLRRPELPFAVLPLAILGPVLVAVAGILVQLDFNDIASEFTSSGPRKEARAEDLVGERSVLAQSVGLSGALAMAFATILISQSAMRAGLLSRFLGILGIVVGAIYVMGTLFPLGTDLVQLFWLLALGLIFMGKWPGGRGPAWETGEAVEWPSAADRRAELLAAEERESEPVAVAGGGEGDAQTRTRNSRKRKKKKRR
jgi:hypothetical protein